MDNSLKQYMVVTANYWAFTLTDGALRMLVVLYCHQLGYSPLEVAMLFLLYELCGVITNFFGGWLAAHMGLNTSMHLGLILQILALAMLLVDPSWLTVTYVMVAQAVSGVAKDLNKMSAKSSIKLLLPPHAQSKLYRWIAILTGSKNTLKGAGFFLGALLLATLGFRGAIFAMASGLTLALILSFLLLQRDLGKTAFKPKFTELFSKSQAVNRLSAARFFLFGSRDVWFVVALPVFLQAELDWSNIEVGRLLALWIISYGLIQSAAPLITGVRRGRIPDGKTAFEWSALLCLFPALIVAALYLGISEEICLVVGIMVFGALFAINSSVHSFLIVHYAKEQGVSLDVGFYYMMNAAGRLIGTILSGLVYQKYGIEACLIISSVFIAISSLIAVYLPQHPETPVKAAS